MPRTRLRLAIFRRQHGAVDSDMFPTPHLQRGVVTSEVDGIAAPASRLTTNRAIAAHERIWLCGLHTETHRLAMARTLEQHDRLLGRKTRRAAPESSGYPGSHQGIEPIQRC